MRLQSHVWVSAFLRQVATSGGQAVLLRRGEASAGAIFIKVARLDGTADLYSPALSLSLEGPAARCWQAEFGDGPVTEGEVDAFIKAQLSYDADIWVVEIEDRGGQHFLGDQLVDPQSL